MILVTRISRSLRPVLNDQSLLHVPFDSLALPVSHSNLNHRVFQLPCMCFNHFNDRWDRVCFSAHHGVFTVSVSSTVNMDRRVWNRFLLLHTFLPVQGCNVLAPVGIHLYVHQISFPIPMAANLEIDRGKSDNQQCAGY